MEYFTLLVGFLLGILTSGFFVKSRVKELSKLRLYYLIGQEEETKFVKDKVLQVEFSLHTVSKKVEGLSKKIEALDFKNA